MTRILHRATRAGARAAVPLLAVVCIVGAVAATALDAPRPIRTQVAVVGGGPAGIAAAVAAARQGRQVVLVTDDLGGVLVHARLNQFDPSRGRDGQSSVRGVFLDLYRTLGHTFDPSRAAAVMGRVVRRERNIRLVTGARTVQPLRAGRAVTGLVVEAEGADRTIHADVVIDATDDADVAAAAGVPHTIGRAASGLDRRMQAATLLFRLRGVDWQRVKRHIVRVDMPGRRGGFHEGSAWGYGRIVRAFRSRDRRVGAFDLNLGRLADGTAWVNALHVFDVDGTDPRSRRAAHARATRGAAELVAFLRRRAPGFERATLVEVAPELYIRETRHIRGLYVLTATDVMRERVFWDRVAAPSYPIDLHPYRPGEINPFGTMRYHFTVPLRSLIPRGADGLLVASRAFSASYQAAGAARIVPAVMALGEAAGVAAAVCVEFDTTPREVARNRDLVAEVQQRLRAAGARLEHAAE